MYREYHDQIMLKICRLNFSKVLIFLSQAFYFFISRKLMMLKMPSVLQLG